MSVQGQCFDIRCAGRDHTTRMTTQYINNSPLSGTPSPHSSRGIPTGGAQGATRPDTRIEENKTEPSVSTVRSWHLVLAEYWCKMIGWRWGYWKGGLQYMCVLISSSPLFGFPSSFTPDFPGTMMMMWMTDNLRGLARRLGNEHDVYFDVTDCSLCVEGQQDPGPSLTPRRSRHDLESSSFHITL